MNSIQEHESKMTIFFSKQTGEIKAISQGIQSMKYFASNEVDFIIIYDFIVLDKDEYVMKNYYNFKVIDRELKLKDNDLSKYL